MKKTAILVAVSGMVIMLSGCINAYVPANSFAAAVPGLIYSQTTHTSYIGEKITDSTKVKVLADVKGSATATNTLLMVATGDCSVGAAKTAAFQNARNADDILNMEVNTSITSVLSLFTSVTTTVTGTAVQYQRAK